MIEWSVNVRCSKQQPRRRGHRRKLKMAKKVTASRDADIRRKGPECTYPAPSSQMMRAQNDMPRVKRPVLGPGPARKPRPGS